VVLWKEVSISSRLRDIRL